MNTDLEVWKTVKDFPDYEISSMGRVKSNKTGRGACVAFLKSSNNGQGYKYVSLRGDGSVKNCFVHRLVAEAFLPIDESRNDVNHKNGIKHDNRLENLEWCNKHENMRHAYDIGLLKSPNAKLCERDVEIIRRLWFSGVHREVISDVFEISFAQISRIVNKGNWKAA